MVVHGKVIQTQSMSSSLNSGLTIILCRRTPCHGVTSSSWHSQSSMTVTTTTTVNRRGLEGEWGRPLGIMEVNSIKPVDDALEGLQGDIRVVKVDRDRLTRLFDPVTLAEDEGTEVSRAEEDEAVEVEGLVECLDGDI